METREAIWNGYWVASVCHLLCKGLRLLVCLSVLWVKKQMPVERLRDLSRSIGQVMSPRPGGTHPMCYVAILHLSFYSRAPRCSLRLTPLMKETIQLDEFASSDERIPMRQHTCSLQTSPAGIS